MDENMKIEETTEVTTVENTNCETETSSGSSTIAKIVIVGVVGAVAGAAGLGLKKLKARNEKKTIERLREKGYTITEPDTEEEDVVEGEVVSEEDAPDEEK